MTDHGPTCPVLQGSGGAKEGTVLALASIACSEGHRALVAELALDAAAAASASPPAKKAPGGGPPPRKVRGRAGS